MRQRSTAVFVPFSSLPKACFLLVNFGYFFFQIFTALLISRFIIKRYYNSSSSFNNVPSEFSIHLIAIGSIWSNVSPIFVQVSMTLNISADLQSLFTWNTKQVNHLTISRVSLLQWFLLLSHVQSAFNCICVQKRVVWNKCLGNAKDLLCAYTTITTTKP